MTFQLKATMLSKVNIFSYSLDMQSSNRLCY